MIWESEGEFSAFDFDVEDPLQSQPKSKPRNQQKRACALTFQEIWTWSTESSQVMRLEAFQDWKTSVMTQFKARLLGILGTELQSTIHFLSMSCNFECLHEVKASYDVPIRCYMQGARKSKFALDQRFQANADWKPLFGGSAAEPGSW